MCSLIIYYYLEQKCLINDYDYCIIHPPTKIMYAYYQIF